MTDADIIARLTSRKFIVVILTIVVNSTLLALGLLDKAGYQTLAISLVGGYLAANVVQKATAKPATTKAEDPTQAGPELGAL